MRMQFPSFPSKRQKEEILSSMFLLSQITIDFCKHPKLSINVVFSGSMIIGSLGQKSFTLVPNICISYFTYQHTLFVKAGQVKIVSAKS